MISSPRRPSSPSRRGPRRVSAVAVVVVVLGLGGAVAAVYGTGVLLGSRIAPGPDLPDDGAAAPGDGPGGEGTVAGPSPSATGSRGSGSSLPDRVERRPPGSTTVVPGSGPGSTGGPGSGPDLDATLGPYPAVWPYGSWTEVRDHVDRGDPAFTTPEDTARRFAEEVVGLDQPRLGTQRVTPRDALIDVRSSRGTTTVVLTRPDLGAEADAPWGVVSAGGDVTVTAGPAGPGRVDAAVRGAGPAVVAVDDRVGWRGVARTVEGSASVRIEPGPAVPAAVVAMAGDPRAPDAFAVQRIEVGAGSPAPAPPDAAGEAAVDLAAVVAAGDVAGVWNGLDGAARAAVTDWRGLVDRWDALSAQVAPFGGGTSFVTRIPGPDGPVDVVSAPSPDAGAVASVFRPTDRGSLLVSVATPPARWAVTDGSPPTLTVRGPTSPSILVLDGAVRPGEATGPDGLTVALTDLAAGPHVAVAVFLGDEVAATATIVTTAAITLAPPEPVAPSDPTPEPDEPRPSTTTGSLAPDPSPRPTQPAPPPTAGP